MTSLLEGSDDLAAYFNAGAVPDEEPNAGNTSTDPICEVCGTPLHYSGRGRKPKFCDEHKKSGKGNAGAGAPQRRSATREVDAALASLEQFNAILAVGFTLASPNAANFFVSQQEALQERNKGVLEANPKLAKQIASAAGKTGPLGLVISYGIVMIPALRIAKDEREAIAAQYADEQGQ